MVTSHVFQHLYLEHLLIVGFTIFLTGLILDSISRHRIEEKKVKFKLFN